MAEAGGVIRLHGADNVVIALADLGKGTLVEGVALPGAVPRGHKIAARAIARQSSRLSAIGFSTSTCLPACAAATACCAWN